MFSAHNQRPDSHMQRTLEMIKWCRSAMNRRRVGIVRPDKRENLNDHKEMLCRCAGLKQIAQARAERNKQGTESRRRATRWINQALAWELEIKELTYQSSLEFYMLRLGNWRAFWSVINSITSSHWDSLLRGGSLRVTNALATTIEVLTFVMICSWGDGLLPKLFVPEPAVHEECSSAELPLDGKGRWKKANPTRRSSVQIHELLYQRGRYRSPAKADLVFLTNSSLISWIPAGVPQLAELIISW